MLSGDFNTVFNRSLSRCGSDPFDVSRESFCAMNRLLNACSCIWRYLQRTSSDHCAVVMSVRVLKFLLMVLEFGSSIYLF